MSSTQMSSIPMTDSTKIQEEYEKTRRLLKLAQALLAKAESPLHTITFQLARWLINDVVKSLVGKKNQKSPWAPERLQQLSQQLVEREKHIEKMMLDSDPQSRILVENTLRNTRRQTITLSKEARQAGEDILESTSFRASSLGLPLFAFFRRKILDKKIEKILSLQESLSDVLPRVQRESLYSTTAFDNQLIRTPRVDIVVCIHNAKEDVERCLESLRQHTNQILHRMIFVDDGSAEETAQFVREKALELEAIYHRNEVAQGFTLALEKGISLSKNEVIVSLNSDTIVGPHWIPNLLDALYADPQTAIVGPFSNAATWQSLPEQTDEDGGWMVNAIPTPYSLEEYTELIEKKSILYFPQMSVLNGFCLMIKRSVYNKLGGFNDHDFPKGYGEEDDFLIRLQQAGYKARLSDNTYVYHAKSKSFTPEGRKVRVQESKQTLQRLHGKEVLRSLSRAMHDNEELLIAREWTKLHTEKKEEVLPPKTSSPLSICWIQPHLKQVGGIRRVIEMTNYLTQAGHKVTVATPSGERPDWLPLYGQVAAIRELTQEQFDIGIISDPDMVESFSTLRCTEKLYYHLAAYMLYRAKDEKLERFYKESADAIHVTNSTWTGEMLAEHYNIQHQGVFPGGIDHKLFFPQNAPKTHNVVCYGSKRPHKGTGDITEALSHSPLLSMLKLEGLNLPQQELAYNISRGEVFVSACWHEGFNFCPLEAMSCGIPVVLTDDGGSREFAKHEENCFVVPPKDPEALHEAIQTLLSDKERRKRYIVQGLKTASTFTWPKVCSEFTEFLEQHASSQRSRQHSANEEVQNL